MSNIRLSNINRGFDTYSGILPFKYILEIQSIKKEIKPIIFDNQSLEDINIKLNSFNYTFESIMYKDNYYKDIGKYNSENTDRRNYYCI